MKTTKRERLGDILMEGVRELEAIFAAGKHPLQVLTVRKVRVVPAGVHNARGIKSLRKSLKMSTAVFADCMGVSAKLVEQWESGRRKPSAPACRLLDLLKDEPTILLRRVLVHEAA